MTSDDRALPYMLTPAEAAEILRCSKEAIYVRAKRGLLPGAVKDGKRLLIRRDDLLQYLSESRTAALGGPGACR